MKVKSNQHLKAKAFTLAETLIVIGIIGVVAALTLPNLNHATGDKEKVTRVKKIYSSLTDAFDRAQAIYGPCEEWIVGIEDDNSTVTERFAKRIAEFMKISKECGFDKGCFSESPLISYGAFDVEDDEGNSSSSNIYESNYLASLQDSWLSSYMYQLSDNISIAFRYDNSSHIRISVDIDGPQNGKNQIGNDIFDFSIYTKGSAQGQLFPSCSEFGDLIPSDWWFSGGNVTAWVVQNGNLDYLKCPEDLNWDTQTSCK